MTSGAEMSKRLEKSTFSVTCSLLSQYIKEKGSLAELGLGMPTRVLYSASLVKPEFYRPLTTMTLLPGVDISGDNAMEDSNSTEFFPQSSGFGPAKTETNEPEKSQLTIFYGGKVLVFDNFPADKAKDLLRLTNKAQNLSSGTSSMVASGTTIPVASTQSSPETAMHPASFPAPARAQPNFSDLPIARKASLHRFLEKRKSRISAKAPYQLSKTSGSIKDVVTVKEEISQAMAGSGASNYEAWIEFKLQQINL